MREFPKDYIIRFNEGQQMKLLYVGESEGVFKYETSYVDKASLKKGKKIKLYVCIEHTFLDEDQNKQNANDEH